MNQVKVTAKRHLAKTISYRIISTLIGVLIMWWITGEIKFGAAFGIVELVYKPFQYYLHERIWYRWISYGLIKVNSIKRVNPNPPQQEPRVIKEGEQPIPEIKRLTYSKKFDN
jgi:uncharacterized membrane protein